MGTFKTRKDFMAALEKELKNFNVSDKTEILGDFDQHFEESLSKGLSEEEICQKLGNIDEITEIARQYAEDATDIYYRPETETPQATSDEPTNPSYQEVNKTFTTSYFNIDVGVVMASTTFGLSGDNNTYVAYKSSRPGVTFSAEINGTTLEVKERIEGLGSWLFGLAGMRSTLEVLVPKQVYDKATFLGVSGDSEIDRITAQSMSIKTTSGSIHALVHANDLEINTISGKSVIENCGEPSINSLKAHITSGTMSINGFSPSEYDFATTSGKITATALSGNGKINLITGKASLDYAEWNGSTKLSLVSGNVEMSLPEDSGANLTFSRASGMVKYNLGIDKGSCRKNGEYSFGGTNRQPMEINTTSGFVSIDNK